MSSPASSSLKGYLYVLFAVFVWAGWVIASRFAVKGTLTAYDVTALRFGTAGLIMLPVVWRKGLGIAPHGLKGGLALAALMGATYTNIAVMALHFAPVSHATLIQGSLLVTTTGISLVALGERFSPLRFAGLGLSLAGIGIFSGWSAHNAPSLLTGHVLFMLAGVIWGVYTVLARVWRVEALHATALVCVWSLLYLPFYFLFAQSHIAWGNFGEVLFQMFYQGVMTAIVAFIAYTRGILLIGVTRASALVPLVPVLSTLGAIPLLHEWPSSREMTGVIVLSLGVLLASGALERGKAKPVAQING
jgi:drug/metabolite transporter (DMT)-like permease